jgi:hypothetical protein
MARFPYLEDLLLAQGALPMTLREAQEARKRWRERFHVGPHQAGHFDWLPFADGVLPSVSARRAVAALLEVLEAPIEVSAWDDDLSSRLRFKGTFILPPGAIDFPESIRGRRGELCIVDVEQRWMFMSTQFQYDDSIGPFFARPIDAPEDGLVPG